MRARPDEIEELVRAANRLYTRPGVWLADRITARWAAKCGSPYAPAVVEAARMLGRPGGHLLNYSYEWGCTAGVAADAERGGMTLLRTLDWPFPGLGRCVVAAVCEGAAGSYASVTWPGYAGVLTGVARGRYAAAINQPPLPLPALGKPLGWIAARVQVGRQRSMPASHLLRHAFESCADFASACDMLSTTPICAPAIFTVCGTHSGQWAVIERLESSAHAGGRPYAANQWTTGCRNGAPRDRTSVARHAAMGSYLASPDAGSRAWSFDWLLPPILQDDTRLAVVANPHTGELAVQGWESGRPATETLRLAA